MPASLWSVEQSTMRMREDVYANIVGGMTKTEAVRQAKVKLINTRVKGISFSHPFLWAPFVFIGRPK